MKTAYDPNHPIETLYTQMEQAIDFSNAVITTFNPSQIFVTAYNLVFKIGLYNDTCREWLHRLTADKNWANFQDNYYDAAQYLRKSQSTARSLGYHSANAASEETNAE